ncbi:CpsD/CapB family tyrosine-protein kinase [Aliiroseovarius sp. PrR006]|uniref:CpsD/CapB family tyrosine-protein kinase n=1 Tax=Aliiroseovarius sp. PrR006 TaxID=2706883 RepID=UPI0013D3906A|nr:CpsD/CapB family tyrosine-protein kinase [Aliiroseovarius sp. PrR006]NDW52447.1 CpsD/CapB family tyrosine-protein kinase [Aliiroseovarius sp. PrR006]
MLGWFVSEDRVSADRSFRILCRQVAHEFGDSPRNCVIAMSPASTRADAVNHALMLAATLESEVGASVLLVDGSFQARDSLTAFFGARRDPGFAELCADPKQDIKPLLKPTSRDGIKFLPRGKVSVALKKGLAKEVFDALRETFDYVLINQEPTTSDARNLEVLTQADLVLLWVEEGKTRTVELDEQEHAMNNVGVADIRVVVVLPERVAMHKSELR